MSQLQKDVTSGIGKPEKSIKITWADFVQIVLELTIKAYQTMQQDLIARQDWEENVFTVRLGDDYIRPIAFDYDFPIFVNVRSKIHTELMRSGEQSTREAKEIDLLLFGSWEQDYHKKHFVWEAKRVGDKRVNKEYSVLNSKYINEAIYRFIRSEYADGLSDAGILGYVLAGNVEKIVSDINNTMKSIRRNPALPKSNYLNVAEPILDFEDVYYSRHKRTDNTFIRLHHLFLSFKFA